MSSRHTFTSAIDFEVTATLDDVTPAQYFHAAFIHFDSAPTTSEDVAIWFRYEDTENSQRYDTLIYHVDPSTDSDTDIYFAPYTPIPLEQGESIQVKYLNTDANTINVTLKITAQL